MKRRLLGCGLLVWLLMSAAVAQTDAHYPVKPIRLIIPFTPGGSTDILGRAVAQALTEAWNQQVIVDNKPGAGGTIGCEAAAKAPADGYTLLMGHIGTLAVNPGIYAKLPYDPVKDFAPVTLFAMVPNILVVRPSMPVRTLAEFLALARAKPGALNYGSGGTGSAAHLAAEYLKLMSKTDMVHVPYKGTGPVIADLLGGQLDFTMTGLPPAISHLRAGKLRAIATGSTSRLALLPEVPTIAEAGLPGFDATQWYGVLAPAGTAKEIVDRLQASIVQALGRPEFKRRLEAEGADPVGNTSAEFTAFIAAEIARWGKVIRAAGIRAE
jgi:tripartite-type tricarboxylate transporter receptor subunit TctC